MASEPPRERDLPPTRSMVGGAIAGALVLGADAVWGALEIAALLAFEGATTAGAAYAIVHLRRRQRRGSRPPHPR